MTRREMTHNRMIASLLAAIVALPLLAACGSTVNDTISDAGITARVKTAFINDKTVGDLRIDVETFKGVVTLSGRVPNKEAEARAIELAKTIRGVVDVKSALKIEGS